MLVAAFINLCNNSPKKFLVEDSERKKSGDRFGVGVSGGLFSFGRVYGSVVWAVALSVSTCEEQR